MEEVRLTVLPDAEGLAEAAAGRFVEVAREAARRDGRFTVALSGGTTPRRMYRKLARSPFRDQVDWAAVHVFFGDERCVPPDHPESNYRMARECLLDHVPVPGDQIHRMLGEARDPRDAAASYEAVLRGIFRGEPWPRFHLTLLGIGADGHTASLFPGTEALHERKRWVAANYVPKLEAWRLTLTLPALNGSRRILFLVSGEGKARVLAEGLGRRPHHPPHPWERVRAHHGVTEVMADRAAAPWAHPQPPGSPAGS